jgi:hypothetical protein
MRREVGSGEKERAKAKTMAAIRKAKSECQCPMLAMEWQTEQQNDAAKSAESPSRTREGRESLIDATGG